MGVMQKLFVFADGQRKTLTLREPTGGNTHSILARMLRGRRARAAATRHNQTVRDAVVVRGLHPAGFVPGAVREVVVIAVKALGTQIAAVCNAGHIALGITHIT